MNKLETRILHASLKEHKDINFNYTKFQRALRLDGHTKRMGVSGVAVYLMLLDHRNNTTGMCCPSYKTLADELGSSKSTMQVAVNKLVDLGYILRVAGVTRRNELGQIKAENNQYIIVPLNLVGNTEAIEGEADSKVVSVKQTSNKATEEQIDGLNLMIDKVRDSKYSIGQERSEELRVLLINLVGKYGYEGGYLSSLCGQYEDGLIMDIYEDSIVSQYKASVRGGA